MFLFCSTGTTFLALDIQSAKLSSTFKNHKTLYLQFTSSADWQEGKESRKEKKGGAGAGAGGNHLPFAAFELCSSCAFVTIIY